MFAMRGSPYRWRDGNRIGSLQFVENSISLDFTFFDRPRTLCKCHFGHEAGGIDPRWRGGVDHIEVGSRGAFVSMGYSST